MRSFFQSHKIPPPPPPQKKGRYASLLRRGLFYFFILAGKWGEVTSKRAKPGENRNESAPSPALPLFFIFRVFRPLLLIEGASAEERDDMPKTFYG